MYNPVHVSAKVQQVLIHQGWSLNQRLLRSFFTFWAIPTERMTGKGISIRNGPRRGLPHPGGPSLTDHYGKRATDINVERL